MARTGCDVIDVDWMVPLAETRAAVLAAINRLGRHQATAVLLHVVNEEPYEAVAAALGCSQATARVHVLRARQKLRRWLAGLRPASREEVPS